MDHGAPLLSLEYASLGQDEEQLQKKIAELLEAGTRFIWSCASSVRAASRSTSRARPSTSRARRGPQGAGARSGPTCRSRRSAIAPWRTRRAQPAPTKGFESLDAVRREGREEGHEQGSLEHPRRALVRVLDRRGIALPPELTTRIEACAELATLERWFDAALEAKSAEDALR